MKRRLYLAAYDIRSASRLQSALYLLKGYASGRQKSVFECFLIRSERQQLIINMSVLLDSEEDRFLLLPLASADGIETLGKGVAPEDKSYFYIG